MNLTPDTDYGRDVAIHVIFFVKRGMKDKEDYMGKLKSLLSIALKEDCDECHDFLSTSEDTEILVLTLLPQDQEEPAEKAWRALWERFFAFLSGNECILEIIWGYTLVFQAMRCLMLSKEEEEAFNRKANLFDQPMPLLIKVIGEIIGHVVGKSDMKSIVSDRVDGGWLYLLLIPSKFEGKTILDKGIVYVALSDYDDPYTLVVRLLAEKMGALVRHDVLVHKAFFESRQYFSKREEIREASKKVYDESIGMLKTSVSLKGGQLRNISNATHRLYDLSSILHGLHESVEQQKFNYKHVRKSYEFNTLYSIGKIAEFHEGTIEEISTDLDILMKRCDRDFEVAKKAIELVNAQIEGDRSSREKSREWILTIAGAALAVPQLVDQIAAKAIFEYSIPHLLQVMNFSVIKVDWDSNEGRFIGLMVQIFCILFTAIVLHWILGMVGGEKE